MAVQKSRKTRSRRGMRRSHDALTASTVSTADPRGEAQLRHNHTADAFPRSPYVVEHTAKY